jgi:hypothetical protein
MNTRIVVRCQDGLVRHKGTFATRIEAGNWAWWGHVCASHHDYEEVPGVTEVDAGNLHVGDVLYLPGDIEVTITAVDWVTTTNDVMTVSTEGGRQYTYRFADRVERVTL